MDELVRTTPSLYSMYEKSFNDICSSRKTDADHCRRVLFSAALAYRPLLETELVAIIDLPPEVDLTILIDKVLYLYLELDVDESRSVSMVRFVHVFAREFILGKLGANDHSMLMKDCLDVLANAFDCKHYKQQRANPVDKSKPYGLCGDRVDQTPLCNDQPRCRN
ncbi:putative wd-repeat protein [Rosellinia necatrix]|uniref:Putative wd-repeat protein n=1 Tax=Rosellinia necatrix TaxID=77044 RepID=A0A1S8ABA7_ROSNE|nr:putative wd-repeat protein [Rosellinia necatrix]